MVSYGVTIQIVNDMFGIDMIRSRYAGTLGKTLAVFVCQVEMLTCFGKPVAHVTLRSATAAAAMHRLCEQLDAES